MISFGAVCALLSPDVLRACRFTARLVDKLDLVFRNSRATRASHDDLSPILSAHRLVLLPPCLCPGYAMGWDGMGWDAGARNFLHVSGGLYRDNGYIRLLAKLQRVARQRAIHRRFLIFLSVT